MVLFDLNNDTLIKIQEEVAIKRKHKLFLSNFKKHRDQFYTDDIMMWDDFDMDCFEDHLNFRNGYWYQSKYFVTDQYRGKCEVEWEYLRFGSSEFLNWVKIYYPIMNFTCD